MREHKIKLLEYFADDVLYGDKCFEIRENDRGYQKGDIIKFIVIDKRGIEMMHPLSDWFKHSYQITYVINGWGLKDNYVVFGIKPYKEEGAE